ncbi:hypothetical protein F3Y22_tig00116997pilonHSYRG01036 [Hibiscus syriacus]|uniref:Retrotransposon gag domain-containing protein n=1 Tax=Hibiscus syriacus TaxID=106335 RepID=A0A6A2WRQ2_HIBSY|nr:hypothetical protein F3Y22_tig00116997pilonHSYRG01036 [Hibiscus syriacus]
MRDGFKDVAQRILHDWTLIEMSNALRIEVITLREVMDGLKNELLMCKRAMSDDGVVKTFVERLRPGVMLARVRPTKNESSRPISEDSGGNGGDRDKGQWIDDRENSLSSQEVASTDRDRIKPSGNHGKAKSVSKKNVSSTLKCYFCDDPHMIRGCPEKNRFAAIVRGEDKSEGEVVNDGVIARVKAVKPGERLSTNASGARKSRINKRDPLKCFLCQRAHRARSCPNTEKLGVNASGEAGNQGPSRKAEGKETRATGVFPVQRSTYSAGMPKPNQAFQGKDKAESSEPAKLGSMVFTSVKVNQIQKQNGLSKPNFAKELAKDAEEVVVTVEAGVGKGPKESETFQEQSSSVHTESEPWSKLMNLRHDGTLKEYASQFEELMLQVPELTEEDAFFTFTDGLKPWAKATMERRGIKELSKALIAAESIIELGVNKTSKPKLKAGGNDKSIQDEGQSNNDEEQGSSSDACSSDACSSEVCSNGEHLSADHSSGEHMSRKYMYDVGTSKADKCLTPRARKEKTKGHRSKGPQELQAYLDKSEWSEKMEKLRIELPKDMGEDKGATDPCMSNKDVENLGLKAEPSKGAIKTDNFEEVPTEWNVILGSTIEETTEKGLMESKISRDMMGEKFPPMGHLKHIPSVEFDSPSLMSIGRGPNHLFAELSKARKPRCFDKASKVIKTKCSHLATRASLDQPLCLVLPIVRAEIASRVFFSEFFQSAKVNQVLALLLKQDKRVGGMKAVLFVYATEGLESMAFTANAVSLVTYFIGYMNFSLTKSANTLTNFMGTTFTLALLGESLPIHF